MAKLLNASILAALVLAAGCTDKYEPRETILDEGRDTSARTLNVPKTVLEQQAYQEGVRETLLDMKGKMRARNRYTYEAPHVECGVQIPARVANGSLIPSHEACIQIAPSRFIEEAPTFLPELGN